MKIEDEIKQKRFRSSQHKALLNLIYTSNWLQNKQQNFFKEFGITGTQFNILRILRGQHPNSISATEIKSRMLDQNSDVSRLLDRLELKQLITKHVCPEDKRASNVYITEPGIELLNVIDRKERESKPILSLTDEEADQLSNLLDRCRG
jgi:DNA-binding MarR family transcriptional regulator